MVTVALKVWIAVCQSTLSWLYNWLLLQNKKTKNQKPTNQVFIKKYRGCTTQGEQHRKHRNAAILFRYFYVFNIIYICLYLKISICINNSLWIRHSQLLPLAMLAVAVGICSLKQLEDNMLATLISKLWASLLQALYLTFQPELNAWPQF